MKKTMKRTRLRRKLLALVMAVAMVVPNVPGVSKKDSGSIVYAETNTWTDETNEFVL